MLKMHIKKIKQWENFEDNLTQIIKTEYKEPMTPLIDILIANKNEEIIDVIEDDNIREKINECKPLDPKSIKVNIFENNENNRKKRKQEKEIIKNENYKKHKK